ARGRLRIDHLDDRVGGCADLRIAYLLDSSAFVSKGPHWRGCPLPISDGAVVAEFKRRQADSLAVLDRCLATGQFTRALPIAAALRRDEVGDLRLTVAQRRLLQTGLNYPDHERQKQEVLYARALAGAGQPRRAVALLDSVARVWPAAEDQTRSERGIIRIRYLRDPGGQRDLAWAAARGWTLRDPAVLAEANLTAGAFSRQLQQRAKVRRVVAAIPDFLGDLAEDNRLQYGAFGLLNDARQGTSGGVFVGARAWPGKWFLNAAPGAGLELLGYPLTVAPKVWFEAEVFLVGGRVDLTYYRAQHQNDLRLSPQFGLSLAGYGNLFYGYNIPLTGQRLDALGSHRITLFINFLQSTKIGG
ncbi:MAG: hypothetical protein H7330_07925, partial [Hymenobacteraceae bacterium]|nr:hypothetical protein [Hymenobacteraceae bacterium]